MEEARAVIARLDRIEALDRDRADPRLVLAELRELVREVEIWTRRERVSDPASAVCHDPPAGSSPGPPEGSLLWANRAQRISR
jgi:hypothetical protein